MKCPVCNERILVEIDTHPDGFADNLQECGACGAVWTRKGERTILVHDSTLRKAANQ